MKVTTVLPRLGLIGLCTCLIATSPHAADIDPICNRIADIANAKLPGSEADIYSFADKIVEVLPAGLNHLEPKTASAEELAKLLNCISPAICPVAADSTVANFFENPEDPIWRTLVVDARPRGNMLFVFTDHSGHDRCDDFNTFTQFGGKDWAKGEFAFGELDGTCDDSSYAIFQDEKKTYVAIPPGTAWLRDIVISDGQTDDTPETITMSIFDPSVSPSDAGACNVSYVLTSRPMLVPSGFWDRGAKISAFLAARSAAILQKTSFDQDTPLAALYAGNDFVERQTAAEELRRVDDFLAKAPSPAALVGRALSKLQNSGMQEYFGFNEDTKNPQSWVARWFPIGVDGHAYVTVLMRYNGPGFFDLGPHEFQASPMVLFEVETGDLVPVASFDLQNLYRFERAEAKSGAADR